MHRDGFFNTIEQLFLFLEQLDQLKVCLPWSRLLTGISILVVFQNLRWNSNKTSLLSLLPGILKEFWCPCRPRSLSCHLQDKNLAWTCYSLGPSQWKMNKHRINEFNESYMSRWRHKNRVICQKCKCSMSRNDIYSNLWNDNESPNY